MTVENITYKDIYAGDGATVVFPYTFRIFADADIQVIDYTIATGAEHTCVLNTDYTVSGAGDAAGGNITILLGGASHFALAPAVTQKLILKRNLDYKQAIDYIANEAMPEAVQEKGLDVLLMLILQLKEKLDRAYIRDSSQSTNIIISAAGAPVCVVNDVDLSLNLVAELFDITSPGANIEDAVTKRHTQHTDTHQGVQIADLDMGGNQIVSVGAPIAADDAARKTDIVVPTTLIVSASNTTRIRGDYKCDGVNDEVEIQNAITVLAAGGVGGRIILSDGTFNFLNEVLLNAGDEDIIIEGQGRATKITFDTNMNDEVFNITADRVTLKNFKIQSANTETAPKNKIYFNGADYCRLENVFIDIVTMDNLLAPLHINDSDYVLVDKCYIKSGTGGNGSGLITIQGDSQYGRITNNFVDGTAVSVANTSGINTGTTGFGYFLIANNMIVGDAADFIYGIRLSSHADNDHNAIVGNVIFGCATDGIVIAGALATENLIDSNMACDGVTNSGTNTVVGDNNVA